MQSMEPLNLRGKVGEPPGGGDFCRDESVMFSQGWKEEKGQSTEVKWPMQEINAGGSS